MTDLVDQTALICGDSRTLNLTVGFDITGYTVFFTVKNQDDTSDDDTSALIKKSTSDHSDPVNGKTSIALSNSDTRLGGGTYKYDFQFKSASGKFFSSRKALIEFVEDVTKRTA